MKQKQVPDTSTTLLRDVADSSHARWSVFYSRYQPMMLAYLRERFPSLDADDIIQETFVALAKVLPDYKYAPEKNGAFHNFLTGVLRNKAISPFTCGATSIALTEDTEITLTLKLGDDVIDTFKVEAKQTWPSDWPEDADETVKAKFADWKSKCSVTDFKGNEAAFLLNVAPDAEKPLTIESIAVEGTEVTVVISVDTIDLANINGKLFVEAGDTLDTMTDKPFTFTITDDNKATGKVEAKFIKAKIGFKAPVAD